MPLPKTNQYNERRNRARNASGFQKEVLPLLEATQPPFPTFQNLKPTLQSIVEQGTFFGWVRPSHLRPQWMILGAEWPVLLVDSRDTTRIQSLRIPMDNHLLQKVGPVLCEVMYDPAEHRIFLVDVIL